MNHTRSTNNAKTLKTAKDTADISKVQLANVFYVDEVYSQKHVHMIHKHSGILELLYIASGEGRYFVGDREYAVHEGDLIICNSDTLHGEGIFQKHSIQTYCIALSGVQLGQLPAGCITKPEQRPVLALEAYAGAISRIMPDIYDLYSKAKDNLPICRQLSVSVLMMTLKLLKEHSQQGKYITEQKNENLVRALTQYLDQHYTEELTLEKISSSLHISISHLSHLFKRETGLSPMQYVIHRRLGEAQSLLAETDIPVKIIEERLGFSSSCHLSAMFKKYIGISPREYRKNFIKFNQEK